eukprot:m.91701 g.91701  ORF g.91701 m.91701 type:complete len:80 (-) comp14910_c0_seq4:2261-2500(-)
MQETKPLVVQAWGEASDFVALYRHNKGKDDDLLDFEKGDRLTGLTRVNDGWYFGTHARTNETGLIPFNYVKRQNDDTTV